LVIGKFFWIRLFLKSELDNKRFLWKDKRREEKRREEKRREGKYRGAAYCVMLLGLWSILAQLQRSVLFFESQ